jgi:hypothetical protein
MKLELTIDEPGTVGGTMSFGEEDITELKKVPESELTIRLKGTTNPKIGLLPPAVRWISSDKKMVVFERPPQYNRVEFISAPREDINKRSQPISFELPMPWQVYLVYFSNDFIPVHIRMYARNSPIEGMDSTLGILPLLNFYASSELCNPIFERFEGFEPSLANGINAAYNMVWNSGFNYDLSDAQRMGSDCGAPYGVLIPAETNPRNGRTYRPVLEGERAYVDRIARYFYRWSVVSMESVLNTVWPTPWMGHREPNMETTLSIGRAIELVRGTMEGEYPRDAQAFMVNLVNTISSI